MRSRILPGRVMTRLEPAYLREGVAISLPSPHPQPHPGAQSGGPCFSRRFPEHTTCSTIRTVCSTAAEHTPHSTGAPTPSLAAASPLEQGPWSSGAHTQDAQHLGKERIPLPLRAATHPLLCEHSSPGARHRQTPGEPSPSHPAHVYQGHRHCCGPCRLPGGGCWVSILGHSPTAFPTPTLTFWLTLGYGCLQSKAGREGWTDGRMDR